MAGYPHMRGNRASEVDPRMARTPGFFSSSAVLSLPVGSHVRPDQLGGYYIDFSRKPNAPGWPPDFLGSPETELHVATAQWALGCYERYLTGEGDAWLAAALAGADHLVRHQVRDGVHEGGWIHHWAMPHTYRLEPPWLSAMAQGEGASLLLRAHAATGEERYAEAAMRALSPLASPVSEGGLRAPLGDGFFLEEYPTEPPSQVLNGGIFALWGYFDASVALADADAHGHFEHGVASLAANLHRWDTGSWSLYDLYPHPAPNVASSFYHVLHINQIRAMELLAPRPEFAQTVRRFETYLESRRRRIEAFMRKAVFRVRVPRQATLARWLPGGPRRKQA